MAIQINKLKEFDTLLINMPKNTVIGEFAGRDSVAAIIKAMEAPLINYVLPIASFSPTEYGNFESLEKNYEQMVKRVKDLYGDKKRIFPLVFYSNYDLWSIINGRFVDYVLKYYGFYTPCIGCHAYLHLIRIIISLKLGKKVISGERESHDGRIKINQSSEAIDTYIKIAKYFGAKMLTPLRHLAAGEKIEEIIGWNWGEGKGHQSCAFSGNYADINGKVSYDKDVIIDYLNNFVYPICTLLGDLLLENDNITKEEMIQAIKDRGEFFENSTIDARWIRRQAT